MSTLKLWLYQWNWIRALRFVLGLLILIQGLKTRDWLAIGLGTLFSAMALLNTGCGSSACNNNSCSK